MLVHMTATAAGPMGFYHAGTDVEVPEDQGRDFLKGHYAVLPQMEKAVLARVETRTVDVASAIGAVELEPVVPFGKYKGKTVREIYAEDPKYVKSFLAKNENKAIAAAAKAVSS